MDLATQLGTWADGGGPLHRKLSEALADAIRRGDLAAGARLPAERTLARNLAVSRSTVVAAYDHLRSEGWLESRQGSGTRVKWTAPTSAGTGPGRIAIPNSSADVIFRRLIEGPGPTISLAAAVFPGAPAVAEAAASFTFDELADMTATPGYMPLGLPALRREIAAVHRRHGLPTTEDQVLVTTGAQQAISLAASLLVNPGDAVLVENPSFAGCLDALRAAGARPVPVPVDADGVDVDALAELADRTSPAAVYLMPSYHNPTGALLAESRRRRLARLAKERNLPIIEDNALQFASSSTMQPPPPIASYEPGAPIITLGSVSKVFWAGLRVGWARADEATIGRLVHCKVVHDLGSPLFGQAVAARLLPDLDDLARQRQRQLADHMDRAARLLAEHVPDWTWHPPVGGIALWVKLPMGDGAEFAQVALRHGVEVVPGATMSPDGSFADHLRLAVIEPPLLDEAIERLGQAWSAYSASTTARPQLRVIV